ncbi:Nitric oxide synthase, oxygenase domain protein [Ectocarpus siliculosus]|uniref:NADPH--hemoprotein reductase n=1 Tax=Ectocarpus siliculosus TaxID=2880 RepID=D8LQZ9_ECTSI|nr:Nitric oxide synthase, oxygenase domain protein [Ectocarpus siliculosus]|eukprot:CBN77672.1 Nitric oxide synthase, oxygenase domain protein [Ectocarpus siliculosus]
MLEIQEFPSAAVTAEDLALPLIKPRHYSIATAVEVRPTTVQLTVAVLKAKEREVCDEKQVTIKEGLCSQHLSRTMPGELVGSGSGISPLMGFLEARAKASRQGKVLAPCLFYFGCRDSSEILYANRLQTWLEDGELTELHVAKSREGPNVMNVQDLISRQQASVWELLRNPTCHVYVCGDSAGEAVKAEAQTHGWGRGFNVLRSNEERWPRAV